MGKMKLFKNFESYKMKLCFEALKTLLALQADDPCRSDQCVANAAKTQQPADIEYWHKTPFTNQLQMFY